MIGEVDTDGNGEMEFEEVRREAPCHRREKKRAACGALEFTSAVCRVRSRLSQFCKLMCRNMKATDDEETLREAFKMLDKDGSGCIDKDELRDLLRNFSAAGETLGEEDIEAMIAESDVDGDGQVSFDEFAKVMMKDGD